MQPSSWQPPDGFVEVDSATENVRVFAPAPEPEPETAPETFPCPACGAGLGFDPSAGSIACGHCGHVADSRGQVHGLSAEEFEFHVETLERAQHGWGTELRELVCETCSGTLTLPEGEMSARCAFCSSNRVVVGRAGEDRLRPAHLVPFRCDPAAALRRLKEWLGRGWMHPAELARAAGDARMVGIYTPFWTFDTHVKAAWQCEVAYTTTETYWSGGKMRTRTVTRWRPESGHADLTVDDRLVCGTERLELELLKRVIPFDLSELVAYDPSYLAGWRAQAYDIGLQPAWDLARMAIRERARRKCRQATSGQRIRNFQMLADFDDERWRHILLPLYVVAYRFAGKTHQVLINGQSGRIAGRKPIAWKKVSAAGAAWLVPGALLSLIGLLFTDNRFVAIAGVLLFVGGIFGAAALFSRARSAERGS